MAAMSDEESDWDDEGPFTRCIQPVWRSHEFTVFLHGFGKKHGEGTRGLEYRVCDDMEISKNLPLNCYAEKWLLQSISHPALAQATTSISLIY
jgi:hypothetical protein